MKKILVLLTCLLHFFAVGFGELSVKVTPSFVELPEYNNSAIITCDIGNLQSAPIIEWYFMPSPRLAANKTEVFSPDFTIIKNGYAITLTNATRSANGLYSCYVTHKIGNNEYRKHARAEVHVNYAPEFSSTEIKDLYEVTYDTTFQFEEKAVGDPAPTVEYFFRKFTEDESKNRKLESINVQHFQPLNDGIYTLKATNKIGTVSKSFKVQGKK